MHVEDLREGVGKPLRFLGLLGCGQLPLVAGDRLWPAATAAATPPPTAKRRIEANGSGARREPGAPAAEMHPGRGWPPPGRIPRLDAPEPNPRRQLEREPHAPPFATPVDLGRIA